MTVLLVEQNAHMSLAISDRAYVLRDGHTVAELSGERLNEHAVMAAMAHGTEADHARHEGAALG